MLLFVLIPIAWLAISVLVVGICRMAARGDAMPMTPDAAYPARPTTTGAGSHQARTRARLAGHGARVHGAG
jgi:hypothetical protein